MMVYLHTSYFFSSNNRLTMNDSRVEIRLLKESITNASPITDHTSRNFRLIRDAVQKVHGCITVPGILVSQ